MAEGALGYSFLYLSKIFLEKISIHSIRNFADITCMKKYFLKDKSLNNIDDDQFRYQDFANNLRKLIEYNEVPFNIAVIGYFFSKGKARKQAKKSLNNSDNDSGLIDSNTAKQD